MTIKIYIAGPITGIENNNSKAFQEAEEFITGLGLNAVNPLKDELLPGTLWVKHIKSGIQNMLNCDAVYALKGWHNCKWARAEVQLAEVLDMPIFEQCDKDNIKLALFKPTNPVFGHTPQHFVPKRDGETGTPTPQYLAAMMQKSSTVDNCRGEARHIPPVFPHQNLINAYAADLEMLEEGAREKHGPWVQAVYEENASGYTDEIITYAEGKPVTICYFTNVSDGEHEANAALIAAAPELLSALKGMVALEEKSLRLGDIDICKEHQDALNAINKAEGRK